MTAVTERLKHNLCRRCKLTLYYPVSHWINAKYWFYVKPFDDCQRILDIQEKV